MLSIAFLYLASCPSYATLSQTGLLEVPVTYRGSLGYFPAWGLMLLDGHPLERLLLMGGPVCAACFTLAWSCTLSMHTPPPGCYQLITGGPNAAKPLTGPSP
jgi:hypothetical protein